MSHVIIIGCGAAGMMAAISAADSGNKVTIYEKNEKAGKKLYITGKGRCNITNACATEELFNSIISNSKFMYSSIYSFTNNDVIEFFNNSGCPTKIERGDRVFPISDKSSDVISALYKAMQQKEIDIHFNTEVSNIVAKDGVVNGVILKSSNRLISADKIIIATGGLSYPSTGSTGDGYRFATSLGHTVTKLTPSLVPIELKGSQFKELQGLSLKNVTVSFKSNQKEIYNDFGEMIFTHFGISGPIILSASSYLTTFLNKGVKNISVIIDLKPKLSIEQLDARILRDFEENINKNFKNSLDNLLPKKLISVIIDNSEIDPFKKVNLITREERAALVRCIKELTFEFKGFRDYNEAIITKGGISVKEINPTTLESKLVKGLFFAGEVLDIDALTGGFNLQLAWSTGYAAGQNY